MRGEIVPRVRRHRRERAAEHTAPPAGHVCRRSRYHRHQPIERGLRSTEGKRTVMTYLLIMY